MRYADVLTRLHHSAVYLPISYISMMSISRPQLGYIPFLPISDRNCIWANQAR